MRCRRCWVLGAIAAVVAALAVAIPVASSAGASARGNLARAQIEATRLLGLLRVPPGAVELRAEPRQADHGLLAAPGYDEATPNLVDAHHWWRVRGSATKVLAYVTARLPRGAKRFVSGSGGPRPAYYMKAFSLSPIPGVLSERVLAVSVAALTPSITLLRTDGEAVWIVPRPVAEKVPTAVDEVDIKSTAFMSRSQIVALSVSQPAQVARIVSWINAMGVAQPGAFSCPMLGGPTVTFVFRAGEETVARASGMDFDGTSGECNSLELSIGGRVQLPLVGDFFARVQRLLGVRFDQSRESPSSVATHGESTFRIRVVDVLRANGIGSVRFGSSPGAVRKEVDSLLGQRGGSYQRGGSCGLDHLIKWWDQWTGSGEPALAVYFRRSEFAGYQVGDPPGPSVLRSPPGGWSLATIRGLRVGDTLGQGRRLYGHAFMVSTAQGGSWKARVAGGLLTGYAWGIPGHGVVSRVATIDAGDVGCPAVSP